MGRAAISREEWLAAAAAGLWSAGFLLALSPRHAALGAGWFGATLFAQRVPLLAAALSAVMLAAAVLGGLPPENPAPMAPCMIAAYSCARFVRNASGLLALPLLLTGMALPAGGQEPLDMVFMLVVSGTAYCFGLMVRRRSESATHAAREAAILAARDPQLLAGAQADAEGVRVSAEAMEVVGRSVVAMQTAAHAAAGTLLESDIDRVLLAGKGAIARLQGMLLVLRRGPTAPADMSRQTVLGLPPAARWRAGAKWLVPLLSTGALFVLDAWMAPWLLGPGTALAAAAVIAALLLRGRVLPWSCAVVACVLPACVVAGAAVPQGLFTATAYVILAWRAAVDGRRASLFAFVGMAAVVLVVLWLEDPENVAINAGIMALAAYAGHAWTTHGRAEKDALSLAEERQVRFTAAFDAALAAGRLDTARAVHDIASHAVGAMVMQANAALALRAADPRAARAALAAVADIGRDALAGLATMRAPAAEPDADGAGGLASLTDGMRAAGLDIRLNLVSPVAPQQAGLAYRVVREALFNVARHAPGSTATINVMSLASGCAVEVVNGAAKGLAGVPGTGFGLQGLAELMARHGGTLHAGPVDGGAFRVLAQLPPAVRADASPVDGQDRDHIREEA